LGTPHAGAGALADWANKSAKVLSLVHNVNVDITAVLRKDSEVLANLQQKFHSMQKNRGSREIDITCFYEQREVPSVGFVGFELSSQDVKLSDLVTKVVPPDSAILTFCHNIPLDKNHTTMTKFESENDPDFTLVSGEIRRWVSDIEKRQSKTPNPLSLIE